MCSTRPSFDWASYTQNMKMVGISKQRSSEQKRIEEESTVVSLKAKSISPLSYGNYHTIQLLGGNTYILPRIKAGEDMMGGEEVNTTLTHLSTRQWYKNISHDTCHQGQVRTMGKLT